MTARKFNDNNWDFATFNIQANPTSSRAKDESSKPRFRLRHALFYTSLIMFMFSPVVWWLSGEWGAALIAFSLGGFCFFVSSLLVPTKVYYVNTHNESD